MRYLEIKNRILESYQLLPKNQKKVADFIIENFDKIPFNSVQEVSKYSSASVATIVRFAQKIGFSGYSELREQIAINLQNDIEGKDLFQLMDEKRLSKDTLTAVANQDIQNINDTLNCIERINFKTVVNYLLSANRVYTIGLGISNLLAQILAYQLNQIGIDANPFRHDYTYFPEQLVFLKPDDMIVAFSFPPYSKETIETAKYARERKSSVVAITDRDAAPINLYSNVSLCVKSENMLFTNSFAAISVLINAISTECAVNDKSRAETALKDMNQMAEYLEHTLE